MSGIIVPEDIELTTFTGYVRAGSHEYKLRVTGVQYGEQEDMEFQHAQLEMDDTLAQLLVNHQETMRIRLVQSRSLTQFLREMQDLLAVTMACSSASPHDANVLLSPSYYAQLVAELDEIGWHHLIELHETLTTMELQVFDPAKRCHAIRLTFPPTYPRDPPHCGVDAPDEFQVEWHSNGRLRDVIEQFQMFLNPFQAFWDMMDEIDRNCCVLEPQRPTRATTRRRIAVEKYASIQITVDPMRPQVVCELSFFGREDTTSFLRQRWHQHAAEWAADACVVENLERILGIGFPSPTKATVDDFAIECGICYTYRLELTEHGDEKNQEIEHRSIIPDRLCENTSCNRPFHEKCLFEWLKALPNARQSFHTVFGECPYCRDAISAKLVA